jgi:O-antigen biosynthesis protein WbqP
VSIKRLEDIVLSLIALGILAIPMVCIGLVVRVSSRGPVFFLSPRVGRDQTIFCMVKFRTMKQHTPLVATDLLDGPMQYITPIGKILRRYSLDELPQLINVLLGDMTLVGPRPALPSQRDLLALRHKHGLTGLRPGITGWAQVNGRDHLTIEQKVFYEKEYCDRHSIALDLKIFARTIKKVLKGEGVSH